MIIFVLYSGYMIYYIGANCPSDKGSINAVTSILIHKEETRKIRFF